jgi:GWxTD domain-containing protein
MYTPEGVLMRHCVFALAVALMLFSGLFAKDGKLNVTIDYGRFRYDSSSVYLELYYAFAQSALTYKPAENRFRADVLMHATITRADSIVANSMWRVPCYADDTTQERAGKMSIGVSAFSLKPGDYRLRVVSRDAIDSTKSDTIVRPLHIEPFPIDKTSTSDIELCTSIKQIPKDQSNIFYKNTLEVVPNPSALYGVGLPILYYYIETYNLLKNPNSKDYFVKYMVLDATGKEVRSQEKAAKKRVNESSVEVGTVNVSNLNQGTYTLVVLIADTLTREAVSSRKKFFVYNPGQTAAAPSTGVGGDVMSSEYGMMTETDLDREFASARYIALEDEMSQYESLKSLEAKRKFVFEFWKRRDRTPGTPENETKQEYAKRVEYSNQNFHTGMREGWRTDRGRVWIIYGQPDEIERHANEIDTRPYEIWYYHGIEGGVLFAFVDKSGFSDYILVHSTHRNELRDDDWQRQIKTN